MNHIDVMTALRQGMRQPIDLHGIAAKTVRRIERGDVQKIERSAHFEATR
jgi:hypothetical protein